jgi:hypothetical protein
MWSNEVAMKKLGIALLLLLAAPLGAQTLTSPPPASLGYCYYAAGNDFLPIASGSGGSIVLTNPPPASLVFGNYAAGPNYQPLQCDSSGNLIISGGGSTAFSALTGSTNTTAAMLVGTGASLGPTGTGTVTANALSGTPAIPSGATATTQAQGTNNTSVATMAALQTAISATWYISPIQGTTGGTLVNSANRITAYGFIPTQTVTFGAIYVVSHTADASNLYSVAIANSSGGLICHPTTGQAVPTANTVMTNTCSEGTVTITAGTVYILLLTGSSTTGLLNGAAADAISGPYLNTNTQTCTSASGVISGTCAITLAEQVYNLAMPSFTLH